MLDRSNYGAVIFDDDNRPGLGWASVKGKTAFRIKGLGDLPTDVYWWTNLNTPTFAKHSISNIRYKRDDYLKPNMHQLHQELGLILVRVPASRIVEVTAEIFNRVMKLSFQNYGLLKPAELTLSDDLYNLLVVEDQSITPEVDEALRHAYQTWASCETRTPENAKIITFRKPRIQHSLDVLSTPIPGDQWDFIESKRLPPENKRIDWLVSQSRPALVRASVKRVKFEYSKVVSFGGGALIERTWMSHPELLVLSRFADVKVEMAFLAQEYAPQRVYRPLISGGALGMLSISNGILAENYWIALASSKTHKKFSKDRITIHSPRAVWLSADDRLRCMLDAIMMDASGFTVKGYGRGKVTVAVQKGALHEARACASVSGLNAPLYVHEDISLQRALAS